MNCKKTTRTCLDLGVVQKTSFGGKTDGNGSDLTAELILFTWEVSLFHENKRSITAPTFRSLVDNYAEVGTVGNSTRTGRPQTDRSFKNIDVRSQKTWRHRRKDNMRSYSFLNTLFDKEVCVSFCTKFTRCNHGVTEATIYNSTHIHTYPMYVSCMIRV